MLEELKYPIGKPNIPFTVTEKQISEWISVIENFPAKIESITSK
ncbi:MAG: metal-dependent hydrolase, partial [Lutibacter sp.]|nr:metal-dependent hydrolase [Lutibacter sp.]